MFLTELVKSMSHHGEHEKEMTCGEYESLKERELASKLLNDERGRLIISQALYYGIKALEAIEPKILQEESNLDDMKLLRDWIFNYPDLVFEPIEQAKVRELLNAQSS